jgi:ATP-dependent helicase/nuclease subunit B
VEPVTLLPRGANLISAVSRALGGPGTDLSGSLAVFPGRRPGHFLRKELAAAGTAYRPPRVLSMDELVDELFDAEPGTAARPRLDVMDSVAILYGIQTTCPSPLGGDAFMSLDAFFPLGARIAEDLEELLLWKIEPRKVGEVQALIEQEVPLRSRERLQTLRLFFERFYAEVEARGFSTRGTRYRAVCGGDPAAGLETLGASGRVVIAGFFGLTAAEKDFFRALAGHPRVSFLFQDGPGMAERLRDLGLAVERPARADGARGQPEVRLTASPDVHGQVFAVNAALADAGEGTVVVLPDPASLFPLLRGCLSRFPEDSYNVSLGYPLTRTPLHGFLSALTDLIASMAGGRVYLPDYLRFALHPYTKNIRFRGSAEATRVLLHTLEESLARRRGRRFLSLEEIEQDDQVFRDAAEAVSAGGTAAGPEELAAHLRGIHDRTVRGFLHFGSVREFAQKCMDLVSYVHEASTAPSHPFFTPFSEALVLALRDMSRSLLAGESFTDQGGYFSLLRRCLATRYFPFPGTPLRGLQVLGSLETRGLAFRTLIILDANEGSLPETGTEASLLPHAVRAGLGLPTYRDREEISAYHFDTLIAGAREVSMHYVQGGGRQRSRYVERLLWEMQLGEGTAAEDRMVAPIQYRVNLANGTPAALAKSPEAMQRLAGASFSATSLDNYLACPLRFYYRHVLCLGRREEAGEIDSADIGSFVHAVLARHFAPRTGRPLTRQDVDPGAMAALVDEMFEERYGGGDAGGGRLLKTRISTRLQEFLTRYVAGLVEEGAAVLALEKDLAAERGGRPFRGRVDAVLQRRGAPWLVDYKTGHDAGRYRIRFDRLDPDDPSTWRKAVPSLQLPVYIMLAAQDLGRSPEEVSASILLLGRRNMGPDIEVPLFTEEHTAVKEFGGLMRIVDSLVKEIMDPDQPFSAPEDFGKVCKFCDFKGICGTKWLV